MINENFILLNHPFGDCKLYVGAIPPPPDEAVYAAVQGEREDKFTNIGRAFLMVEEVIAEARRRNLPNSFPVALMRESRDCFDGRGTLLELDSMVHHVIHAKVQPSDPSWLAPALKEYRRLKKERDSKCLR